MWNPALLSIHHWLQTDTGEHHRVKNLLGMTIAIAFIGLCLSITAYAAEPEINFKGFSVQQPDDKRWRLHRDRQKPHIAVFFFSPLSPTHSFNATIQIRGLPTVFKSKEAFKEFIESKIQEHSPRYETLDFSSSSAELHGQWAIRYQLHILDRNPANAEFPLVMTIKGIVFLHPLWNRRAIDAVYSERGTEDEVDGKLDPIGESLIGGIIPKRP